MHVRRAELVLAAVGAVAVVLIATGVSGPLRAAIAFPALLLLPGWAVLREVRLEDPVARVALAVMMSVTLAALVGIAMLWADTWHPAGAAVAMLAAGVLAILVHPHPTLDPRDRRRPRQGRGPARAYRRRDDLAEGQR